MLFPGSMCHHRPVRYVAWEIQVAVDPSEEHAQRLNLKEYNDRLMIGSTILPDPLTLTDGMLTEEGVGELAKLVLQLHSYISSDDNTKSASL